jgi:TRAP-type C4-dicarboxylate transport system permease small subunit
MDLLEKINAGLTRVLDWFLIVTFAVFLTIVFLLVVMRYGFSYGITGSNEFVVICFIYTSAIGMAVGVTRHEHIAITVIIDLLPRTVKLAAYVLGLACIAVINAVLAWLSIDWMSKAGHYPWQPFEMPQMFVHMAIFIGCGLCVFYCFVKSILAIGGRVDLEVLWLPED